MNYVDREGCKHYKSKAVVEVLKSGMLLLVGLISSFAFIIYMSTGY